jgi:hypothetical protein
VESLLINIILASGFNGPEYLPALNTLEQDHLLGKFVFIRNQQSEIAAEIRHFGVASLETTSVFTSDKLTSVSKRPPPLPINVSSSTVTSHGGLISPQSESHFSSTNNGFKPIDPSKASLLLYMIAVRSRLTTIIVASPQA